MLININICLVIVIKFKRLNAVTFLSVTGFFYYDSYLANITNNFFLIYTKKVWYYL